MLRSSAPRREPSKKNMGRASGGDRTRESDDYCEPEPDDKDAEGNDHPTISCHLPPKSAPRSHQLGRNDDPEPEDQPEPEGAEGDEWPRVVAIHHRKSAFACLPVGDGRRLGPDQERKIPNVSKTVVHRRPVCVATKAYSESNYGNGAVSGLGT